MESLRRSHLQKEEHKALHYTKLGLQLEVKQNNTVRTNKVAE